MAGFIFLLFVIFVGCCAFFKLVKPANSPFAAAAITTAVIQLGIWCLPILFRTIGALITIAIAASVLGLIFFMWKTLKTKI